MLIDTLKSIKRIGTGFPGLVGLYLYDFWDFARHSPTLSGLGEREALVAVITVYAHNIEKGLSLPKPRSGFGERNIKLLIPALHTYIDRYGHDDTIERATGVLRAYVEFNLSVDHPNYPFQKDIAELLKSCTSDERGGVKLVTQIEIQSSVSGVTDEFFNSRSSVRVFEQRPVELAKIEHAIRIAQKAPSVCNRQSGFVYVVSERDKIDEALRVQGGANGFADNVPMLLVITTRTRNFFGPERNQRWVDGGLFAMSLILGLHMQALGTCSLNWSKPPKADRELKKILGIDRDRSIIFLLAVGEVPQQFRVAKSEKRPLAEMYTVV